MGLYQIKKIYHTVGSIEELKRKVGLLVRRITRENLEKFEIMPNCAKLHKKVKGGHIENNMN